MKKYLIASLMVLFAVSVFADSATVRLTPSRVGTTNAARKQFNWGYKTANYVWYLNKLGASSGLDQKASLFRSGDGGATWSADSTFNSTSAINNRPQLFGRSDTVYVVVNASTGTRGRIYRFRANNAYSAATDSARLMEDWTGSYAGYTEGAMTMFSNGKMLGIIHLGDTLLAGKAAAWASDITWTKWDSAYLAGGGFSNQFNAWHLPVLAGILSIGSSGGAFYTDTLDGIDTACGAANMLSPGGSTAEYRTAFSVLEEWGNDSAKIGQVTQVGDDIRYMGYILRQTGTGRDTLVKWDSATIATTAEMPTPTSSGAQAQINYASPNIIAIRGGNKALIVHKFAPDAANDSLWQFVYYISEDNGGSWGSRVVCKQQEGEQGAFARRNLISYPTGDEVGGSIRTVLMHQDSISTGTNIDTIRAFYFDIVGASDPVHTLTQVKIGHTRAHLKDSVVPVNGIVDSMKLYVQTTNPPTTVELALDTTATTRISKSHWVGSLTRNTKYYYRWAIKDDVGWDTSAVDSFTTKDSLAPKSKYLSSFGGATTAQIQCSVLSTIVEPYNGTLVKWKLFFDIVNPPTQGKDSILLGTYPKDTMKITALEPSTKYYIYSIVTDSGDTATGVIDSFTTGSGIQQGYYIADTNTNSFIVHDTLKEYVDSIARVTLYVNAVAANVLTTPVDSTVDPAGTVDTLTAASLTSGQKYYFRLIAQDGEVWDTTALDSVTTLAIAVDLGEVTALLQQLIIMNDTLLDGFLRGSHGILSNIGGAVYGYLTSPSGDRIIRISDSTALARWIWDKDVSVYDAQAESLMAGYAQNRANMFDPIIDTVKFVQFLINNLDTINYLLASAGYDSITNPIIAEIQAHQSTAGGSSGPSQSLGTNMLPYPTWGTDTVTYAPATAYTNYRSVAGWYLSSTKNGTNIPSVSIDSSTATIFPVEDLTTNIQFSGTYSAGVYDSVRFRSPLFKLYPGFYKYGARMKHASFSFYNTIDTIEIKLRNTSNVTLDSFFVTVAGGLIDSVYKDMADDYYVTTATDAYMVMRFVNNHGNGLAAIDWTYAFVNLMGYNLWAVDSSAAGVGTTNMGRISILGGTGTSVASLLTQANIDTLLDRTDKTLDTVIAILDTVQDGVNGHKVNVQAIADDSSGANALAYAFDTSGTGGNAKLTLQQVRIGPAADGLTNPLAITAGANSVSAVGISQGTGNAAAVNISGGGTAVSLSGGATAASGLSVAGSGGAKDVTGTFVDSVVFSGDVSLNLTGLGTNVRQKIYARDTSGTDEYVADVFITIRAIGTVTNAAGPLVTNDSGLCNFTLPNGTFEVLTRKGGYQFITDTITVTGDGTFTVDGYNTTAISQCAVWGYVGEINSTLYGNATVVFTLANKVNDTCNDVILTNFTTSTRTDQNGRFEKNLIRSSCLSGEQYNVKVLLRDGTSRTYTFTVPDQTTYQLIWN